MKKLIPLCLVLVSCAAEQQERHERSINDLRTRAAFDFACKSADLEITCLKDERSRCMAAGVVGCNQRAAYLLKDNPGGLPQWASDSSDRRPGSNTKQP